MSVFFGINKEVLPLKVRLIILTVHNNLTVQYVDLDDMIHCLFLLLFSSPVRLERSNRERKQTR